MNSWKGKYKILSFDTIDSTNSEAIRLAKTAPCYNYVISAQTQTNGRGKQGKTWHSPTGNLYASLLLKHHFDISILPQLSFVAALAVHDTIKLIAQENAFQKKIRLKWPNDVLIHDKKISGILLEAINNDYLIVGVGINIMHHPHNIGQPTTSLSAESIYRSPEEVLDILITNFERYYQMWRDHTFNKIRQLWLSEAYRLNERMMIDDGNQKISGIFRDLDMDGRIILQLPSSARFAFSTGELAL